MLPLPSKYLFGVSAKEVLAERRFFGWIQIRATQFIFQQPSSNIVEPQRHAALLKILAGVLFMAHGKLLKELQ